MTVEKKRIYILVKTYPTISKRYGELVCTAGVLEDGSWIRLYPVPYRMLDDEQKYPKYTWIEVETVRNAKDFRPESHRPNIDTMIVEPKPSRVNWNERRKIVFKNQTVYTNMQKLIVKAKSDNTSLALFRPTKILDFKIESDNPNWDPKKLASLRDQSLQYNLFKSEEEIKKELDVVVQKIPYKFSYIFEDEEGKKSSLKIEDWEIGMLYLNCLKGSHGNKKIALAKVREQYYEKFLNKDLYFFLGTTLKYHKISRNPFIIVGIFYPPKLSKDWQLSYLD